MPSGRMFFFHFFPNKRITMWNYGDYLQGFDLENHTSTAAIDKFSRFAQLERLAEASDSHSPMYRRQ